MVYEKITTKGGFVNSGTACRNRMDHVGDRMEHVSDVWMNHVDDVCRAPITFMSEAARNPKHVCFLTWCALAL